VPPAIAMLSPFRREGQHVVRSLANGAQDGAVFGGERLGELLGEVRGGQRHAPHIWVGQRPESSRLGTRAVSPARSVEPSPSLRRTARRSYGIPGSQESLERHGSLFRLGNRSLGEFAPYWTETPCASTARGDAPIYDHAFPVWRDSDGDYSEALSEPDGGSHFRPADIGALGDPCHR
jgi:hypothetical protein